MRRASEAIWHSNDCLRTGKKPTGAAAVDRRRFSPGSPATREGGRGCRPTSSSCAPSREAEAAEAEQGEQQRAGHRDTVHYEIQILVEAKLRRGRQSLEREGGGAVEKPVQEIERVARVRRVALEDEVDPRAVEVDPSARRPEDVVIREARDLDIEFTVERHPRRALERQRAYRIARVDAAAWSDRVHKESVADEAYPI